MRDKEFAKVWDRDSQIVYERAKEKEKKMVESE